MNRRRLLRFGLIVGFLAGLVLFFLWWMEPNHQINRRAMDRIQIGTREEEVVRIIGVPAGDYKTGLVTAEFSLSDAHRCVDEMRADPTDEKTEAKEWVGDSGAIIIYFNANGIVRYKCYLSREEMSWQQKLRRWLGIRGR